MKLIDILVQHKDEIAERGEATNYFAMDPDGRIFGYQSMPEPNIIGWSVPGIKNSTDGYGCLVQVNPIDVKESWKECIVTLKQYESALAASKSEWDGEGLPPVGCVCEVKGCIGHYLEWHKITVFAVRGNTIFFDMEDGRWGQTDSHEFRPISSEADRKRAEGVIALSRIDKHAAPFEYGEKFPNGELICPFFYEIYDAIAAGNIPHIRID